MGVALGAVGAPRTGPAVRQGSGVAPRLVEDHERIVRHHGGRTSPEPRQGTPFIVKASLGLVQTHAKQCEGSEELWRVIAVDRPKWQSMEVAFETRFTKNSLLSLSSAYFAPGCPLRSGLSTLSPGFVLLCCCCGCCCFFFKHTVRDTDACWRTNGMHSECRPFGDVRSTGCMRNSFSADLCCDSTRCRLELRRSEMNM